MDIRMSDSDSKCDRTEESQNMESSETDFQLAEDIPPIADLSNITKRVLLTTPPLKDGIQFDQPNRKLSPAFHQALLSFCRMSADSRLGSEVT
ncbi:hypothetical protein AB205_0124010 [Aquarana catesbeiana]|uniref:Uncharacterized protein n=1 Tax=Aquarana catesbeiana TaxID=8400 RepID=A0A2G9RSC3_AQUCT|nr:hypothetical protein AB205_0124010 [Aquarana catesbeiana]